MTYLPGPVWFLKFLWSRCGVTMILNFVLQQACGNLYALLRAGWDPFCELVPIFEYGSCRRKVHTCSSCRTYTIYGALGSCSPSQLNFKTLVYISLVSRNTICLLKGCPLLSSRDFWKSESYLETTKFDRPSSSGVRSDVIAISFRVSIFLMSGSRFAVTPMGFLWVVGVELEISVKVVQMLHHIRPRWIR